MRPLDPARPHQARTVQTPRLRVPVSLLRTEPSPTEKLIRLLARDRLRELRDDGVTIAYIGRMYGVTGDRMKEIEEELKR